MRSLTIGLILVGFAALSVEAALLGSGSKCSWGPAYWCQGFASSRECGATTHCINQVWSKMRLPEDNDDVCTVCKDMVKQARDTLQSNQTQEELKQVFEGSCALIPVKLIREQCDNLVDQFIPELVETLASEMNPSLVCATAGLCSSVKIDQIMAHVAGDKNNCEICRQESRKLAREIDFLSKDRITEKFLELCGSWSSYSDACRATVLDNQATIAKMVKTFDEKVCDLSGMCSATFDSQRSLAITEKTGGDVQCEFCEKVIQHWVDTWTANTTQEEFKEVLEALCKKLDRSDRVAHCLHIVDDWYVPWFQFLLHEIDPHMICKAVGLCGMKEFFEVDTNLPMTMLLASRDSSSDNQYYIDDTHTPTTLLGGFFGSKTARAVNKPGCIACEYILGKIESMVDDPTNQQAVEDAVKRVCIQIPSELKNECLNLVDTYGPALVEIIVKGVDPSTVCPRIGLCVGDDVTESLAQLPVQFQVEKKEKESCMLCHYAMDTIFDMLHDRTDVHEIQNVLDSICYKMPHSIRNECQKLVAEYTEPIIHAIVNNFTPDEACSAIKMCDGKKVDVQEEQEPLSLDVSGQQCVLCEYVITYIDQIIGDKHNEEEVKEALEKVCTRFPKSVRHKCTDFVDTYIDTIIDLITHEVSPKQVCTELGLCHDAGDGIAVRVHELALDAEQQQRMYELQHQEQDSLEEYDEEEGSPRPYCTLCEYAIGEVDKMISDKKNEEEIKNVLDNICYELSAPIGKECLKMVNSYTDEIIDMFVQEYTPAMVCQSLGFCAPPKKELSRINNDINGVSANDLQIIDIMEVDYQDENGEMEEVFQVDFIPYNRPQKIIKATKKEKPVKQSSACVLCEYGMTILEQYLLNNRSIVMVERGVQMICSYMPETIADKCEEFVDQYGDQIIHLIAELELDPRQVCAEIQLCEQEQISPIETKAPATLGKHRCSWGPAYWCQSRFHAKACGTLEHCEKRVWLN